MPPKAIPKPDNGGEKSKKSTFKWCPEAGEKFWYTTVTLADMRKAAATGVTPNAKRKELVRIPSKQERQIRYDLAAEAIASLESQLLPTFGGRPWTITVKVSEPSTRQKPPLFRYFRGSLELAVLPHLLAKVPQNGMKTKGMAKHDEDGTDIHVATTALSERNISQLSTMAWNDTEYMIPTVMTKWLSPNHKIFTSRKSAEEEATRLQADQLMLDKLLFGVGARGQALRPTKPTRNDALRVGKLRFLRDGIWVVGQEDAWHADRANQLEIEEQREVDEAAIKAAIKAEEQANRAALETATPTPETKKRPFSALTFFVSSKRNDCRDQRQRELDLKHPHERTKFTLKDADTELKQAFSKLNTRQKNQWKEKAQEANAVNCEGMLTGFDYFVLKERSELEERLKFEFDTLSMGAIKADDIPTFVHSSNASSEGEEKKEEINATSTSSCIDATLATGDGEEKKDDSNVSNASFVDPMVDDRNGGVRPVFNRCTVLTKLREQWNLLLNESRAEWTRNAKEYSEAELASRKLEEKIPSLLKGSTDCLKAELNTTIDSVLRLFSKSNQPDSVVSKVEEEVTISYDAGSLIPTMTTAPCVAPTSYQASAMLTSNPPVESVHSSALPEHSSNFQKKRRRQLSKRPPRRISVSDHWKMSGEQTELCYEAAMDHYDKVMYTVKARALFAELGDGFDVLRERGRGRYDMELPAFESPVFSFLTSLESAAWMPIVRQILGEDVTLIHKGVFLSMPGAESQVYHQDGPHLNSKVQRPCHAVNVFIPLVDLTTRNGPTEFCLGSHILGFEDYDKANVFLPLVQAGTPIVFDYRLGHRGLANTGSECRPVVYCTYAASKEGKEFRDSVNFSTKRYHKIGDMVDKPISREERARKRKIAFEQHECNLLIRSAELGENQTKQEEEGSAEQATL